MAGEQEEETVDKTDMFLQGMIYSGVDIGGYMLSGIIASKFESFKSA